MASRGAIPFVLALLLSGCGGGETPTAPPASQSASGGEVNGSRAVTRQTVLVTEGWVDDAECSSCHSEIARSFHHVGMGQSFARWTPERRIENLTSSRFDHAPSRRRYEMVERDGAMFLRRWQIAPDGEPINEIEIRADWIIGSGHHARSYAHQTAAGDLFELPLTWYSQERTWGMSPGFDSVRNPDLLRRIGRDCMACHNTYPDAPVGSDQYGRPHVFPREMREGIGCQRCHGPGARHAEIAARPGAARDEIIQSIVNPTRLPSQRRDDVCLQCHLQPSTAFTTLLRRFGRGEYQFTPGDDLAEHLVPIDYGDAAENAARFEINHHAYRMHQSACYTQSNGGLTCLSCHDPHRKVPIESRRDFHRDKCLTCHERADCDVSPSGAPAHLTMDDCVACHMPARRPTDVVHAVMTDHRIAVYPDVETFLAPLVERGPLRDVAARLYWPERMKEDPHAGLYPLIAEVSGGGRASSLDDLKREAARIRPPFAEPWSRLGDALSNAGRLDEAIAAYREALAIDADDGMALSGLGSVLATLGRLEEARPIIERTLQVTPTSAADHLNRGLLALAEGRDEEALRWFDRSAALDPLYAAAHAQAGTVLLLRMGRPGEAASRFRQALAINPDLPFYGPWGMALRQSGDWSGAIRAWRHGRVMTPDDNGLTIALATARTFAPDAAHRNPAEGLDLALQARRLAPGDGETALTLAAASMMNDLHAEAIGYAEEAARLGADPVSCRLVMALGLAGSGRQPAARSLLASISSQQMAATPGDFIRARLLELIVERGLSQSGR